MIKKSSTSDSSNCLATTINFERIGKLETKNGDLESSLKQSNDQLAEAQTKLQQFSDAITSINSTIVTALQSQNVHVDIAIPSAKKLSKLIEQLTQSKQSLTQLQNQLAHQESVRIRRSETWKVWFHRNRRCLTTWKICATIGRTTTNLRRRHMSWRRNCLNMKWRWSLIVH